MQIYKKSKYSLADWAGSERGRVRWQHLLNTRMTELMLTRQAQSSINLRTVTVCTLLLRATFWRLYFLAAAIVVRLLNIAIGHICDNSSNIAPDYNFCQQINFYNYNLIKELTSTLLTQLYKLWYRNCYLKTIKITNNNSFLQGASCKIL